MAEVFKWGAFAFYVKPTGIRGVKDIEIAATHKTEDSVVDNEIFVKKKQADKYTVSMTAILNKQLGENVRETALAMTEAARNADQGYIYTEGGKLFPFPFMLVSATAGEIDIAHTGEWLHCEVKLQMKQCSKYDGSMQTTGTSQRGSGSSGGGQSAHQGPVTKEGEDPDADKKTKREEAEAAEDQAKGQSLKIDKEQAQQGKTPGTISYSGGKDSGIYSIGTICEIGLKKIVLDPRKVPGVQSVIR